MLNELSWCAKEAGWTGGRVDMTGERDGDMQNSVGGWSGICLFASREGRGRILLSSQCIISKFHHITFTRCFKGLQNQGVARGCKIGQGVANLIN